MERIDLLILTVLLSALFSGLEIAFITANKLKIEVDRNKGMAYAKVLSALSRSPSRFIGSMLVANNAVLVVYGVIIEGLLYRYFSLNLPALLQHAVWILVLQVLVATLIILVFGEFIPKTLFRINANGILRIFSYPAYFFYILFSPVVSFFTLLAERLLKLVFKTSFSGEEYVFSMVDLDNYLREYSNGSSSQANEQGAEIQMFQNAMDLRTAKIRECMIPRTDIKALEETASLEDYLQLSIQSGHSKILIYKGNIDNIIGYIHSFDLFRGPEKLQEVIKPILIVPGTMLANKALQKMLQARKSIAVVVDEFGGTSGIVTVEDILEEILGEIDDEYDVEQEVERRLGQNEYLLSGRLEIDYLNEKYKLGLPASEDYETLAGLVITVHESIPGKGDEILLDPFVFTIVEATESRVEQVKLKILE